eukprot:2146258-Rhodomonas_salina.1
MACQTGRVIAPIALCYALSAYVCMVLRVCYTVSGTDVAYAATRNDGKSVIMATYLKNGNAEQVPRSVEKYLSKSGVSSLLVGHIPHGETPTVMKGQKAMVVMADTSYSKMGHESWWGVDNR